MDPVRLKLLLELATMPDEAFDYILVTIDSGDIWPSGIGGFQTASKKSIQAVRKLAHDYLDR